MNRTMRILGATLVLSLLIPVIIQAGEAPVNALDSPSSPRGSVIANLLQTSDSLFAIFPYEANYVLFTETSNLNREQISPEWAGGAKEQEIQFQISVAYPISRGIAGDRSVLALSYTQRSWWQLFSQDVSAPFRETNYEPQLFLAWAMDHPLAGWTLREIEIGYNHQSNGRSKSGSHGWNRGYARFMAEKGDWQVDFKPWLQIGRNDDNPDISKYLGHYRLKIGYTRGDSRFDLSGHYNWDSGYGGVNLGWNYPLGQNVRLYAHLFNGYGESLLDYNHGQTRVGLGFILNDTP
jgi:phospholipase A1